MFNRVGRKAEAGCARPCDRPRRRRALEASVVGSFTRVGYHARRRLYRWPGLDSYDLTGRNAIVTGATSGLGLETARILLELGARVCIVGRDPDHGAHSQGAGADRGGAVEAGIADLSLMAATDAFAADFARRHDRLDILVHNAGALLPQRT